MTYVIFYTNSNNQIVYDIFQHYDYYDDQGETKRKQIWNKTLSHSDIVFKKMLNLKNFKLIHLNGHNFEETNIDDKLNEFTKKRPKSYGYTNIILKHKQNKTIEQIYFIVNIYFDTYTDFEDIIKDYIKENKIYDYSINIQDYGIMGMYFVKCTNYGKTENPIVLRSSIFDEVTKSIVDNQKDKDKIFNSVPKVVQYLNNKNLFIKCNEISASLLNNSHNLDNNFFYRIVNNYFS